MAEPRWMIYGANGYTGRLVAEEAVRRGHRPMLAGRSGEKVQPIADKLGLDCVAFALDDPAEIARRLQGYALVFHSAGPFVFTSEPMVRACLTVGASYLDVTGELSVFQGTFAHDADARERGVCLMSGVGFDVVPTDCLARYVSDAVKGATDLEIAIAAIGTPSAGTAKSALEHVPKGNLKRVNGELVPIPLGAQMKKVRFSDKERTVVAIPWGDLETAYHSTGIPNITTYMAQSPGAARMMRIAGPLMKGALSLTPVRRAVQKLVEKSVEGPSEEHRRTSRSYVWARASDGNGRAKEAWLETGEGYDFTAKAGVLCVEKVLELHPTGALTPSLAFGPDFVLGIEGTKRLDTLT